MCPSELKDVMVSLSAVHARIVPLGSGWFGIDESLIADSTGEMHVLVQTWINLHEFPN